VDRKEVELNHLRGLFKADPSGSIPEPGAPPFPPAQATAVRLKALKAARTIEHAAHRRTARGLIPVEHPVTNRSRQRTAAPPFPSPAPEAAVWGRTSGARSPKRSSCRSRRKQPAGTICQRIVVRSEAPSSPRRPSSWSWFSSERLGSLRACRLKCPGALLHETTTFILPSTVIRDATKFHEFLTFLISQYVKR